MSVVPEDISFDPAEPNIGDIVEITVVVRNSGAPAEDVAVAFKLDDELIDNDLIAIIPTSGTAFGSWDTSGLSPGNFTISVKIPVGADETNGTNNIANRTLNLTRRPEAVINIKTLQVDPEAFIDGDEVDVQATIENVGDANTTLFVNFLVDDIPINTDPIELVLPKGQTKRANLTWDTTAMEGRRTLKVVIGELDRSLIVTVGHKPAAGFVVTDVRLDNYEPMEKTSVKIHANVSNIGDASADVVIVFKANTKTFAKTTLKTYNAHENRTVIADWTAEKGKKIIRVEVLGYPDAVGHSEVKVQGMNTRVCGSSVALIGVGSVGCIGVVGWTRKKAKAHS